MSTAAIVRRCIDSKALIVGERCAPRHRYYLAKEYTGAGWLIMPTDFVAVSSGKRRAQAQTQIVITVALVWVMIGLAMLVLLFADQSFSKASIELMCLF